MGDSIYSELNSELQKSARTFDSSNLSLVEEISDDISTIEEVHDITKWKTNDSGPVIGFRKLLDELRQANVDGDRQKCIESIAMLRIAISDLSSAYSNAMDSMEELIVSIRDQE